MREKRESKREQEKWQSRDDDALSSPSQQGNACMHSAATRKKVFTLHERYCCWYWTAGAAGWLR